MVLQNIFHKSSKISLSYDCDDFFCDIIYISYVPKTKSRQYSQQHLHRHPNYELHLILDGESVFELQDKTILTVSKNQFILFPPEYKHRIIIESPVFSKLSCSFAFIPKDNEFYKTAEVVAKKPQVLNAGKDLIRYCNNILRIGSTQANSDFKNSLLFSYMSFFVGVINVIAANKHFEIESKIIDKRVEDAIIYINENISANLTVDDVAKNIHISKKHLERLFKNRFNTTPGNYIKNRKAKAIRDLLLNPDLSISDIAEELQYNNVSSMIKFFKRVEDISPHVYRKYIFRFH